MSNQYSFPILSDREVAQCLHELGMMATVEQLSKPTYEFVQPIYESLVTALTGMTRYVMIVCLRDGTRERGRYSWLVD